jgi:hypothetical protein
MFDLQELQDRLLRLDEDVQLLLDGENIYSCYIVGGGALILMGFIDRATHDVDMISVPPSLRGLLDKYDMNMAVSAHMDCFPEDYQARAVKVDVPTRKIQFFTLSLEDLVISKLSASRSKDIQDITSDAVISAINWDQLTILAEEIKLSLLSDRQISEFEHNYEDYIARYKK